MTPINAISAVAAPAAARSTGSAPGGGDLLAAMRPAMDTAARIGTPTNAEGAASVLATGSSYLQGASSTLAKLDDGIARRRAQLERIRATDPEAAKDQQQQLDLLQRLRDRIQLSIERVSDILAGKDRDDIGGPEDTDPHPRAHAKGHEQDDADLLERRRQLLAPGADHFQTPATPDAVAGAYASASATTPSA
jgi:hypothetical protein